MITLQAARAITEQKLGTLIPAFAVRVRRWLGECEAAGIVVYIYEGRRSCARQAELFAQGRTTKGRKVTNAGPGQSMHQYGCAVDFVPLIRHAKAEGMWEADWDNTKLYKKAQALAKPHGLRALSWETPHLEDATLADWKAARSIYGDPCKP